MNNRPRTRFRAGVAWSFLSRWGSKAIGMVTTVVLARLLTPTDFGIVAMATIFLNMLHTMTQVGIELYVIRSKDTDERMYHAAWTVNVLQALFIAASMIIAAPFIASFFGEQVLVQVIYVLALSKVITGLHSIGVHIAQKQLDFLLDFKVTMATRITYLVSTIGFAWWLNNFWAIVFGQLSSVAVGAIYGYISHPFRPRFSTHNFKDLFRYSAHTVPMNFGRFLNNQLDSMVMARVAPTNAVGAYHVTLNLADMFTRELLIPIVRGIVPNLSTLHGTERFTTVYLQVISVAVYLFLPLGVGLALVSTEFVEVLLGYQWIGAEKILFWLSLYCMLTGIMMFVSEQFLVVMHQEVLSNRLMWMRTAILVCAISVVLYFASYKQLPFALFLSACGSLPPTLWMVSKAIHVPLSAIYKQWWPAVVAVLGMSLSLTLVPWPAWHALALLFIKSFIGATVYFAVLVVIHRMRPTPPHSVEALVEGVLVKHLPSFAKNR